MDANASPADLDRRFGIQGIAKVGEGDGGLTVVKIAAPLAEGEISARRAGDVLETRC